MTKFPRFTLIKLRPFMLSLSCVLAGALLAASVLRGAEASSFAAGGNVPQAGKALPAVGVGKGFGRQYLDNSLWQPLFNAGGMSSALFVSPFFQSSGARSLSLAGGSRVDVPSSASLNITGLVTVEAWIKTTSTADQAIIERYATYPGAGVSNGGYVLRLMGGRVTFATLRNSNEFDYVQGATAMTANVWHHVAGVFDGSQLRVYLDGAADGSKASTFAPATGTAPVRIGAKGDDMTMPFNGLIDEARVSAVALYTVNFTPATNLTQINGVKGLWKFDDQGASDASGFGNYGTLIGTPSFSAETCDNYPPSPDNSLSLDGGARVDVPSSASLNITGPITVEAWVKTTSTNDQAIVERYATYPGAGVANGGYVLRIMGRRATFSTLRNSNEFDYVQGATMVSVGIWHHVAGVFDGSQLRVYLDGALDGSKASTFAPATGTAPLRIGAKGDDLTLPFAGLIDEARVSAAALYGVNFTPATRLSVVANTKALWKLDNQSAADSSGNSNHGTLQGGTSFPTDTPHNPAISSSVLNCLSLNGLGSYVSVPNSSTLNITGPITVEAWIKTNSTAQQGIVERYGPAGTNDGGYALRIEQGKLRFFTLQNAATYDFVDGSTAISTGVWHHVAGVFDGSQLRVYLDGRADGVKASTFAPGSGTQSLKIGARGNDAASTFNGVMDEVRVSAGVEYAADFTARSIREVASAFDNAADGQRGVWLFDGTTNDAAGNNNHGTLVGGAFLTTDTFSVSKIKYDNLMAGTATERQVNITFDGRQGQVISNQYPDAEFSGSVDGFGVQYYPYATNLLPYYGETRPRLTRVNSGFLAEAPYATEVPFNGRFRNFTIKFPKPASNIKFEGIGVDMQNTQLTPCVVVGQLYLQFYDQPDRNLNLCGRINEEGNVEPPGKPKIYDLNKNAIKNVKQMDFHTIQDWDGLDFDSFSFTVPPDPEVSSVAFEQVNSPIDRNPNAGGGQRIFPDKVNPGDTTNRAVVRVKANTTFPANTRIYFKSYDLDDPSTDPIIDQNGAAPNDNRDALVFGSLSAASALTDTNGVATVTFTTGKQPGDNYIVAASADQAYLNGLVESGTGLKDAGGTTVPTQKAKSTEMLTVWRRLHVEVDSMGVVTNNVVRGVVDYVEVIQQTQACPGGMCIVKKTHICGNQTLKVDRFKDGAISLESGTFGVVGNDDLCIDIDFDPAVNPAPGSPFILVDDDDFNGNSPIKPALNGDIGEDVNANPNTFKLFRDSDLPAENVFAPAYIRPIFDGGGNAANNSSSIPFVLNVPKTQSLSGEIAQIDGARDSKNSESDDFWVVYVQLGYQYDIDYCWDPPDATTGAAGGITVLFGITNTASSRESVPRGGNGSIIFLEAIRDVLGTLLDDGQDVPHEVGHQFGLAGDTKVNSGGVDYGIMSYGSSNLTFVPQHVNVLRWRVKSPGQQ